MRNLKIEDNQIQVLPTFLVELKHLNWNNTDWLKNELTSIPDEILNSYRNGEENSLRNYLVDLVGTKAVWNSLKLIIVGKEGVGKVKKKKSLNFYF